MNWENRCFMAPSRGGVAEPILTGLMLRGLGRPGAASFHFYTNAEITQGSQPGPLEQWVMSARLSSPSSITDSRQRTYGKVPFPRRLSTGRPPSHALDLAILPLGTAASRQCANSSTNNPTRTEGPMATMTFRSSAAHLYASS
jgi:hypothetical protein